jgi:hypothetical protein
VDYHPWKYLGAIGHVFANVVKTTFRQKSRAWPQAEGNQRFLEYVVIVLLLAVGAIATRYLAKRLP